MIDNNLYTFFLFLLLTLCVLLFSSFSWFPPSPHHRAIHLLSCPPTHLFTTTAAAADFAAAVSCLNWWCRSCIHAIELELCVLTVDRGFWRCTHVEEVKVIGWLWPQGWFRVAFLQFLERPLQRLQWGKDLKNKKKFFFLN